MTNSSVGASLDYSAPFQPPGLAVPAGSQTVLTRQLQHADKHCVPSFHATRWWRFGGVRMNLWRKKKDAVRRLQCDFSSFLGGGGAPALQGVHEGLGGLPRRDGRRMQRVRNSLAVHMPVIRTPRHSLPMNTSFRLRVSFRLYISLSTRRQRSGLWLPATSCQLAPRSCFAGLRSLHPPGEQRPGAVNLAGGSRQHVAAVQRAQPRQHLQRKADTMNETGTPACWQKLVRHAQLLTRHRRAAGAAAPALGKENQRICRHWNEWSWTEAGVQRHGAARRRPAPRAARHIPYLLDYRTNPGMCTKGLLHKCKSTKTGPSMKLGM